MALTTAETATLEANRLEALCQTGLLDSPQEYFFDLITDLAARALHVPIVLLSLVDAERQFFKSHHGLPAPWAAERETPLSHSFCQYVAAVGEPFIVEDAREHPLMRDNLAVSELGVIGYAGMPLTTSDGFTLGSLCAIDTKPRRWSVLELETLRDFARQIMAEIELRARLKILNHDLGALRASTAERETEMRYIVHDLRTPLNALYLGFDGVSIMGELNADQQACVALSRKNADVLRDLVQRLIEIGAGEQKAMDLRVRCLPHDLIDRALDQVATLAEKAGVVLESGSVRPLPAILGQRDELVRVLVNLIANGVKFTPRGGQVSVSISADTEDGISVIRFTVIDTGIGIAARDHDRIFHEGVRLDPSAEQSASSGIGLAFCQRVIELHGGRLVVESSPDAGSTFSFAVPVDSDRSTRQKSPNNDGR